MENVIKLENITVSYLQNRQGLYSVKDLLLKPSFKTPYNKQIILKNLSLNVCKGETLGVFGPNGCGKSTLLRVIAGIVKPDEGIRKINLPVSPLLALGAGLENELTGIENIKLLLILSGNFRKENRAEILENVFEFSELSSADLKKPVKMYSTGMLARIAISSILVTEPELLIIDEILSVGDAGFQNKCKSRIHEIINNGTTFIFVSHIIDEVMEICKRGICIKDKNIIFDGSIKEAANVYQELFH
ncbi:MAG TPA: ABC transporter ATP-binding protein [Bacteroidales bacterium]|nr:ABC transporter ATP-binding protein [Bacteroidales bacterium]